MGPVAKFFTMFGKDIIQEPLKMIDRQIQVFNARKDRELEQGLQMAQQEFFIDLGLREKEMNGKIQQVIDEKQDERQLKFLEAIKHYQQEMATSAVSIGNSLGKMTVELERQAHSLVSEKKQDYEAIQDRAYNRLLERMAIARENFPEGSDERKIAIAAAEKIANGIIDNAISFTKLIDEEFKQLTAHIQEVQKQSMLNINQYLSPALAKAISQKFEATNQSLPSADIKRLN